MNHQQFILLMVWVCFVSAFIGYIIGGALVAFVSGFVVPMIFIAIGD